MEQYSFSAWWAHNTVHLLAIGLTFGDTLTYTLSPTLFCCCSYTVLITILIIATAVGCLLHKDKFAPSYISSACVKAGAVDSTSRGEEREKYIGLFSIHIFAPALLETSWVQNMSFLKELEQLSHQVFEEVKARSNLFAVPISCSLIEWNAASIIATSRASRANTFTVYKVAFPFWCIFSFVFSFTFKNGYFLRHEKCKNFLLGCYFSTKKFRTNVYNAYLAHDQSQSMARSGS